jgi:hypothetical protein
MGNFVFKVVNNSTCILNIYLIAAGTPWFYQSKVHPGESMERKVGGVWFSTGVKLWDGSGNKGYETVVDDMGNNYTVSGTVAIPGFHDDLTGWFVLPETPLTKKMHSKYVTNSPQWHITQDLEVEVSGGPYCEYKLVHTEEPTGIIHERRLNYFDDRKGLPEFKFKRLSP